MPKEVIHPASEENFVQVGWSRDTFVQLGTVNSSTPERDESGWFLTVGRADINQLIRVLRKARDQAYGVDE